MPRRPLSGYPLTELGRRCRATTRHRGRSVTCDLPRRHQGMHEHELVPERSVLGPQGRLEVTQSREAIAWDPAIVRLVWALYARTRRDV